MGQTGVGVHMGMCVNACICGDKRSTSSGAICIVLETGSPTGVHGSLIRLGWQALDPLTHLPTSKSLSLILEIKEDPESQFSPLGF